MTGFDKVVEMRKSDKATWREVLVDTQYRSTESSTVQINLVAVVKLNGVIEFWKADDLPDSEPILIRALEKML